VKTIARIILNTNNWVSPSNSTNKNAVEVKNGINSYRYGYEEWNNDEQIKALNLGYLECYRHSNFPDDAELIILVYRDDNGDYFHYGNMYNVRQLQNHEIETIRKELQKINWLKKVESQFNSAPFFDTRHFSNHHYMSAWNSNEIVTRAQMPGFVMNIKYKSLNILPKPVNLTKLAGIKFDNRKISRLKSRYYLENFMNNLDKSNQLFKYLKDIK
jgi:hypothetical protein